MTQPNPRAQPAVAERLAEIVGERYVLSRQSELLVYNSDGLPGYRRQPSLAVFPGNREQTIAVVRLLAEEGLPFVPRGAGTGLSGGALADNIVVVGLHRLKEIISLDVPNRRATVEPGVVNLRLNKHVAPHGLALRSGSVERGRVHDRRKRRGERGRSTLPEVRSHAQSRARDDRAPAERRGRGARAAESASAMATTCGEHSSDRRAASASLSTSRSSSRRGRRRCGRCSRISCR